MRTAQLCWSLATLGLATACDSCYGPSNAMAHQRLAPRMQPDALNATSGPRGPLAWGQLNFLHTTDTHGWLEGHLEEYNYGADWGDYASFVKRMREKADELDVDLLLVDTGDLHDGAGLSDATSLNGEISNPIFEKIDYDVLTIGNHELYYTDIAEETFVNFSSVYGEKYVTSNVKIYNYDTEEYEVAGNLYRYFTTKHGLRIMAFGVLFDFTGNSNASIVTPAADMVQEEWFQEAIARDDIDLFLVIGHNPITIDSEYNTLTTVWEAIRAVQSDIPVQMFGGHTHIRDFAVYDSMTTGLLSGRYCETLGFLSMSGINATGFNGTVYPAGVLNPSTPAITNDTMNSTAPESSDLLYFRRYLDWNRWTFAYHAEGSQDYKAFDTAKGLNITEEIYEDRIALNLNEVIGCAPSTWCMTCAPFESEDSIYSLLETALAAVVINETRADIPRLIIINTGSIRFDLAQGPFTYDDTFIVSPFTDAFQYLPDVPYEYAKQVLDILNAGPYEKRSLTSDAHAGHFHARDELCLDPDQVEYGTMSPRDVLKARRNPKSLSAQKRNQLYPRESATLTYGYVTTDAFGTDGDDTIHLETPYYDVPSDLQANASFPTNGSLPLYVDLVFLDYIGEDYVLPALAEAGVNYTASDIQYYLPEDFTTQDYLPEYAKLYWQDNINNCSVGGQII